jgi:isoleucyl-tRNA synthetase
VLAPFMPFLTEEVWQRLAVAVDPAAPRSVHWCDYPQPEAALIDEELERTFATAFAVATLGRKLREDAKLKVRQPLATITVVSRDAAVRAGAQRLAATICGELNVKALAVSADEAAFCTVQVKPNFAALRARAGAKLKDIGAALARWSFAEVAELESGRRVNVAGVDIALADVLLTRIPQAGSVVASAGAVTVALDTQLNPALVAEGYARECVSVLQQARKDIGLEVSDRIRVAWQASDPAVAAALEGHAAYIAGEVLATAFTRGTGDRQADLNGQAIAYAIAKA